MGRGMKKYFILFAVLFSIQAVFAQQGAYFPKKKYIPQALPQWKTLKGQLPSPILPKHKLWVDTYWKAWEIASTHFYEPTPESGFVSQFIDAAFNDNIFLWDTSFMTMFTGLAHPLVPGIGSLDNFYIKQHPDGEISREISRTTGKDFYLWVNDTGQDLFSRLGWLYFEVHSEPLPRFPARYIGREVPKPAPILTLDALNHPVLAWAEIESLNQTGDLQRLQMVWEPLVHYYQALHKYLQQGNGLYLTDWASMDNSTRNDFLFIDQEAAGTGVDISAEMALFALQLSRMAKLLGKTQEAQEFLQKHDEIKQQINAQMWNEREGFYLDVMPNNQQSPIKSIAGFWTLLAKVASKDQAQKLVDHLFNPKTFGRKNLVPSLSADAPGFEPRGGYWRGSIWVPSVMMVIRGLEAYGYDDVAKKIALNNVSLVSEVYKNTGTIWENYAPDFTAQGKQTGGLDAMRDFVGWSGLGPIRLLLEYVVGLKADALNNSLAWDLTDGEEKGCKNYRFNNHVVSLQVNEEGQRTRKMKITSSGAFKLTVRLKNMERSFQIKAGSQSLNLN